MTKITPIYETIYRHITTLPKYETIIKSRWSDPHHCGDPTCPHSNSPFDINGGLSHKCSGHGFLAMHDANCEVIIRVYQLTETTLAIQLEVKTAKCYRTEAETALDMNDPTFLEQITKYLT